jgi:hypothetical protein
MSNIPQTIPISHSRLSSRKRREMMEKVENMVASIEQAGVGLHVNVNVNATHDEKHVDLSDVSSSDGESGDDDHDGDGDRGTGTGVDKKHPSDYDRVRNVDTSIHVSDVSTSDEEEEEEEQVNQTQTKKAKGLDISQVDVYSSGSEESLESLFGSPDELPEILRTHKQRERQRESRRQRQYNVTSRPAVSEATSARSLANDLDMEKQLKAGDRVPVAEMHMHMQNNSTTSTSDGHMHMDSRRSRPHPQDRSVASKLSTSACSKSSKLSSLSAATPLQSYHGGQPIASPPFALLSPDGMRGNRTRTRARTTHGHAPHTDSKVKNANASTNTNAKSYSYTTRKSTSTSTSTTSRRILSPPKSSRVRSGTQSASKIGTGRTRSSPLPSVSMSIHAMKKEIDDLTAQFSSLQEESDQKRRGREQGRGASNLGVDMDMAMGSNDPQDRFEDSLNLMGKKADAMVDALYRNYSRSNELQKDNDTLRRQMRNLNMKKRQSIPLEDHHEIDPDQENKENVQQVQHDHAAASPESLLKGLNSGDEYVKRQYPPVPKTPGTMFATEFVEVMGLDVGDHAYLAEVMDRQWRTTTDYRP